MYAHVSYRRYVKEGRLPPSDYRMPGSPGTNWFVLGFLVLVLILMASDQDTRVSLYLAPVWIVIMLVGFFASRSQHRPPTSHLAAAGTYATGASER